MDIEGVKEKVITPNEHMRRVLAKALKDFYNKPVGEGERQDITLENIFKEIPLDNPEWKRYDTEEDRKNNANIVAYYKLEIELKNGERNVITFDITSRGFIYSNYLYEIKAIEGADDDEPSIIVTDYKPTGAEMDVETEGNNGKGETLHFISERQHQQNVEAEAAAKAKK